MNTPFATSHRGGMRPLAVQGVLAADCHEQLRAHLQQHRQFLAERGMPDAASFLAEPVLERVDTRSTSLIFKSDYFS